MKKRISLFSIFLLTAFVVFSQSTVKEYYKSFPTYPFSDPDPVPAIGKIYPYFRFDGFTNTKVPKEWKVVELENPFIRVLIFPEIGGKIWTAIEKSTNKPYLYYNQVVKFRDIAMRGPWTSGGIELNYGIIGHAPSCSNPVDYVTFTRDDGSVSCVVGTLDLFTMTNWRVEINLPKDKAYFTTRSFWHNSTPLNGPYYNWMNAAIKTEGNLELIYPGTHYIGHDGDYSDWPVNKENGKLISFYENNNFGSSKSYHVLGKYSNYYGGYYHNEDFGTINYAPHEEKAGKKAWIWSLSRSGMIWEGLLTDNDGQYVEIQSGRLHNQNSDRSSFTPFKHRSFSPFSTDLWTETWYPVINTKGVAEANEYGALNVIYNKGWLRLYFSPVQNVREKLLVMDGQKTIYEKNLDLTALKSFSDSIRADINMDNLKIILGENKLVYNGRKDANNLNRPLKTPADFDWNSAYGLYIQGEEQMDQRRYKQAGEKLSESLSKNPDFLPALVEMAELKYRIAQYTDALSFAKKALSIDTYDWAANYIYGLINSRLGNIPDAKDGFDFASLSPEIRSAAYTELSKIYLRENNLDRALNLATKAIDFNRYNITAFQIQSIIYRYMKESLKSTSVLNKIIELDPLNHLARFELFLNQPNETKKNEFTSMIKTELRHEVFFDLAALYYSVGLTKETVMLLEMCPPNPQADYWLSYINYQQGKPYKTLLEKATGSSPEFVFPFRQEMTDILKWALQENSSWKTRYYLGLVLFNLTREDEAEKHMASCGNTPDFAPFYVFRAEITRDKDKILEDLKKAVELDQNEWRYKKYMGDFYLNNNQNEKALAVVEPLYKTDPGNYVVGMLYAKSLLMNRKYKETDALLRKLVILPFEGASEGRDLYLETKLMLALDEYQKKNYKSALKFLEQSSQWPENLGVGKPYDENIDDRLENWITYLCYDKMKKNTEARYSLQKIIDKTENRSSGSRYSNLTGTMLGLWSLEKLKSRQDAVSWLNRQSVANPENRTLQLCKEIFENNKEITWPENERGSSVRVMERILKMN